MKIIFWYFSKIFPLSFRPLCSSGRGGRTTWTRPPYLFHRPWVTMHCLSLSFFSSFLSSLRTRSAALPLSVLCACVGGAWCKGKVKGQCSVTVGEQKSGYEVPGSLSLSLSIRHSSFLCYRLVTQLQQIVCKLMAHIWLRKKLSTGLADWYLFLLAAVRRK